MKDLPPQIDLSTIDFSSFLSPLPVIDLSPFLSVISTPALEHVLAETVVEEARREANRIPKKIHQNMGINNETESLIRHILDDNWIGIFSYLNTENLVFLTLSCKKIANLMNDDGVRERLYKAKHSSSQNNFFKSLLRPDCTIPGLVGIEREVPALQLVPTLAPQDLYNENPPGQGFVMKGRAT